MVIFLDRAQRVIVCPTCDAVLTAAMRCQERRQDMQKGMSVLVLACRVLQVPRWHLASGAFLAPLAPPDARRQTPRFENTRRQVPDARCQIFKSARRQTPLPSGTWHLVASGVWHLAPGTWRRGTWHLLAPFLASGVWRLAPVEFFSVYTLQHYTVQSFLHFHSVCQCKWAIANPKSTRQPESTRRPDDLTTRFTRRVDPNPSCTTNPTIRSFRRQGPPLPASSVLHCQSRPESPDVPMTRFTRRVDPSSCTTNPTIRSFRHHCSPLPASSVLHCQSRPESPDNPIHPPSPPSRPRSIVHYEPDDLKLPPPLPASSVRHCQSRLDS
jgi:hypothetical protein